MFRTRGMLICVAMSCATITLSVRSETIDLDGGFLFTNWAPGDAAYLASLTPTSWQFGFGRGGNLTGYNPADPNTPGSLQLIFGGDPGLGSITFTHFDGTRWNNVAAARPDGSFTVGGTLKASEILVEQNVWADYVLAPDYKLMPLSELRAYINQNGRLPGVPSEQKIKDDGANLGHISKILLEKVEELTLYMLLLEEQNIKLRQDLAKLNVW